jgi:DNA-binding transcriptional LysR family regulator
MRPGGDDKPDTSPATTARHPARPPRILLYVDAVARHGSIRKAADALHIASSALNRRILDLEHEIGSMLFERMPRGVRPTAAGELYIGYVRDALAEFDLVNSRIEQLRGLVRGRVGIAAVESVAGDLLPAEVVKFQAAHPRVRFDIRIGVPKDLLTALIDYEVDLILTHDPTPDPNIRIVTTAPRALCALMVTDHPLAASPSLRLRDCHGYPIALGDSTLAGRMLIEQVLAQASFRIEPALVSNSVEAMKAFSRLNRGICFQFRARGRGLVSPGDMVAVPLVDPPLAHAQLLLATRRDRVLPIAAATFVEQLDTTLRSLSAGGAIG